MTTVRPEYELEKVKGSEVDFQGCEISSEPSLNGPYQQVRRLSPIRIDIFQIKTSQPGFGRSKRQGFAENPERIEMAD